MRAAPCLLLALLIAAPATGRADEIGDQLDLARQYYQEGDLTGAIGELEFVLQALRGKIGQELLTTFPEPPDGATIEAQLMSGGGFLQGLAGMMMNPAMLAAQPNAKRVRVGRESGVVTYDADQRSAQLVLDLGGKATVMLEGKDVPGSDPLEDLAQRWDLKKAKELLGG